MSRATSSSLRYDRDLAHKLREVSSGLVGIQQADNPHLGAKDQT